MAGVQKHGSSSLNSKVVAPSPYRLRETTLKKNERIFHEQTDLPAPPLVGTTAMDDFARDDKSNHKRLQEEPPSTSSPAVKKLKTTALTGVQLHEELLMPFSATGDINKDPPNVEHVGSKSLGS
jgi:hypothetical protein